MKIEIKDNFASGEILYSLRSLGKALNRSSRVLNLDIFRDNKYSKVSKTERSISHLWSQFKVYISFSFSQQVFPKHIFLFPGEEILISR